MLRFVLIIMASKDGESPSKKSKWDEMVSQIEPVANPLASRKLTKRLYKVLKKGVYAGLYGRWGQVKFSGPCLSCTEIPWLYVFYV